MTAFAAAVALGCSATPQVRGCPDAAEAEAAELPRPAADFPAAPATLPSPLYLVLADALGDAEKKDGSPVGRVAKCPFAQDIPACGLRLYELDRIVDPVLRARVKEGGVQVEPTDQHVEEYSATACSDNDGVHRLLHVPEARLRGMQHTVVDVAVLDTGIRGLVADTSFLVRHDEDHVPESEKEQLNHGTRMASLIGGLVAEGPDWTGWVSRSARLWDIQVGIRNGPDGWGVYPGDFACGVCGLVDLKRKERSRPLIANISLEFPLDDVACKYLEAPLVAAMKENIVVVAAAGNSRKNDFLSTFLAEKREAVVVATLQNDGSLFQGPIGDVAVNGWTCQRDRSGGATYQGGTSSAAALVSGVAALVAAADPSASACSIASAIEMGVQKECQLRGVVRAGGRVDALAAIDALPAARTACGQKVGGEVPLSP